MGGFAAFGTLLQMEDASSPGTYLTVAEVKDIGGPSISSDTIDATTHSSPNAWRQKVPGLLDAGDVTFDINYKPTDATHNASTGLASLAANRTLKNWRLVLTNTGASIWGFSGYVTGFELGAPVEDMLTASVTIAVTGAPTIP